MHTSRKITVKPGPDLNIALLFLPLVRFFKSISLSIAVLSIFLGILLNSYIPTTFSSSLSPFFITFAQSDHNVTKHRNLIIDLGNGVSTNAQLSYPAIGKGPYPAVLLIHGSGTTDMDETLANTYKPLGQISEYLSERGYVVLKYDKRGIGPNGTILDSNVWENVTVNDLKHDAGKALDMLINQPEVDPKRIGLIGHSEGTIIAPRVAIDNTTKVENVVLMGTVAENLIDSMIVVRSHVLNI
ncbi:MAG: alpha/beta fold hydrolase [Nitrososphaeraceae archaeon]